MMPSRILPAGAKRVALTSSLRAMVDLFCRRSQFLGACTKQKPYVVITELMACSLSDAFSKTFYTPTVRRQVRASGHHALV